MADGSGGSQAGRGWAHSCRHAGAGRLWLHYAGTVTITQINMFKTLLPAVLALGLVACTAETTELDTTTAPADGNAADMGVAKAQTVTLRLTGMT